MQFGVDPRVFQEFRNYCVGVVVARGLVNRPSPPSLIEEYRKVQEGLQKQLPGPEQVREHPSVAVWREAFTTLDYNPNRYPPSIEALLGRIARGGMIPSINLAVDLINMTSLQHRVPMGAHDLGRIVGDLVVRPAGDDEPFTALGTEQEEYVPRGEYVYADSREVRTRRWIWRQGDKAKVIHSTTDLFIPIDGFVGSTEYRVTRAREEISGLVHDFFDVEPDELWVDVNRPTVVLN